MRKVTTNIATLTAPRWMGDCGNRNTLLPAGALVNALKFPADSKGFRTVASGTLLGRRFGAYLWEPVANAKTTDLSAPMVADTAIGSTKVFLENVSGYRVGDSITLQAGATTEVKTITAIDRANASLSFTATVNAYTVAASGLVRLTTAVPQDEFYLLAFDIENAARNAEVPALYRRDALVRFNFLPELSIHRSTCC